MWGWKDRFFDFSVGFTISPSGSWSWDGSPDELPDDKGIAMRAAGSQISWDDVRKWIFDCNFEHDPGMLNSTHQTAQLPLGFMVIDIEAGCIIDAPPNCSYIALSYVWGPHQVGELSAEVEVMAILRTPGSLRRDTLPATIWDAVTVCQELGVQYLWVDRLCIIQDSGAQKTEQIRSMDLIYSQATLTICALGSLDSQTGLWGTAGTPRALVQGHARVGGIEIMQKLMDDREWRLGHKWWRRAWTYQEYLLSRRKLLFSPWQVTFECNHGVGVEAYSDVRFATPESDILDSQKSRLRKYEDIVEEYNGREFTYLDDIYDAFQGVFKLLYGSLDQYVWGLPASDFDNALLWRIESLDPVYNELNEPSWNGTPRHTKRGVHLASWSWVHRSGRTNLESGLPEVLASVARWHVWDNVRGLQPVVTDGLKWNHDKDATIHAWTAWSAGCIETPLPAEMTHSKDLLPLRERLPREWPSYQDYWRDAFATPATWITPEEVNLVKARTGRILLRTTVASLPIDFINESGKKCRTYLLRNSDGRTFGEISSNSFAPTFASDPAGKQWDFVALSVASTKPTVEELKGNNMLGRAGDLKPLPKDEKSRNNYTKFQLYCSKEGVDANSILSSDYTVHDDEGYAIFPPTVINVMIISWNEGVAQREGLGWVWLAQWMKAKPVFRTIVLE
ncbi:hypothetical protein N0V93_007040 [Gnomoniopsis smithogilvyi]|uniref:Heterokaryon incompatibility domain-containing protein n=1 Tax=Gnomoniopsis smithogilvyi TaxID=1191159 RepID=A0A9W9CVA3_9PEZI|nr:hypothetical protein N0V93_007040 [Gnomoniopsis smithogilvyi]